MAVSGAPGDDLYRYLKINGVYVAVIFLKPPPYTPFMAFNDKLFILFTTKFQILFLLVAKLMAISILGRRLAFKIFKYHDPDTLE